MKTPCLVFAFIACFQICAGQVNWSETSNWRIYNISPNRLGFTLRVDSLQMFKNIELDSTKVRSFLQQAKVWEEGATALWKRIIIITYDFKGEKKKIIASNYGGFLFDQTEKLYYLIPLEARKEWDEFLNNAMEAIKAP